LVAMAAVVELVFWVKVPVVQEALRVGLAALTLRVVGEEVAVVEELAETQEEVPLFIRPGHLEAEVLMAGGAQVVRDFIVFALVVPTEHSERQPEEQSASSGPVAQGLSHQQERRTNNIRNRL